MFTEFAPDDQLWHFLAYCAGTGGSMLIIGSAAGVVAMGMEKSLLVGILKNPLDSTCWIFCWDSSFHANEKFNLIIGV